MQKWKTGISTHKNGELHVRGEKLIDMIGKASFADTAFFVMSGRMPNKKESVMWNAILTAAVEHGVEAPSAFVARTVASTGNQFNAALAAGVLAMGNWHAGAIEKCAEILQTAIADKKSAKSIAYETISKGERLSGYGHKVYKDADPRTAKILEVAKKNKFEGAHIKLALEIEKHLEKESGKHLPLNIDGIIAAVISDLGLDWRIGKGIFAYARMPGLIAHIHEEMVNEKPYRRLEEDDVEYTGPEVV